jgi:hypothetical protein
MIGSSAGELQYQHPIFATLPESDIKHPFTSGLSAAITTPSSREYSIDRSLSTSFLPSESCH